MIASRLMTSPSTSPPLATSTCFAARTVPFTVPSIFTTPSAEMSPTTRMPAPMIDNPGTASRPGVPFSVKTAISVRLLHEVERIERLAAASNFEMQLRGRGGPRVAGQTDALTCRDLIAFGGEQPGGVSIHRLIPGRMPQEDVQAVVRIVTRRRHGPAARRAHGSPDGHCDIDARMGFIRNAGAHLAARHETLYVERPVRGYRSSCLVAGRRARRPRANRYGAHRRAHVSRPDDAPTAAGSGRRSDTQDLSQLLIVRLRAIERRGELLHTTILGSQAPHFALQSGDPCRAAGDRPRERKEQHDQDRDRDASQFARWHEPARDAVLPGVEIAIRVHDDRHNARRHPSKGAPRMSSSTRARSSFE